MKLKPLLLLLLVSLSCATPRETLEKGKYRAAYQAALWKLKRNKEDRENQAVLAKALQLMSEEAQQKKEGLTREASIKGYKKAMKVNKKLLKKLVAATKFMEDTAAHEQNVQTLEKESEAFKKAISDQYLATGKQELAAYHTSQLKQEAQNAYYNFKKAQDYGNDTYTLDTLLKESLELGQKVYCIEVSTFGNIGRSFDIRRSMSSLEDNDDLFTSVYLDGVYCSGEIDCRIEIDFSSLDIEEDEDEDEETFDEKITTTETVTNADGTEEEVETVTEVEATITTTTITKTAKWTVTVNVSGTANCSLQDYCFRESLVSETTSVSITGDERAVPSRYKNVDEEDLMDDDEMAEHLLSKLSSSIEDHLF